MSGCPSDGGAVAAPESELRITYFGVSTLLLDDGASQLLIDGYFTRPGLLATAFTRIGPKPELVRNTLKQAGATHLLAVLTAHAHHDHALDAAEIAAETGAVMAGSTSAANLAFGRGLPARQVCVLQEGQSLQFGPYRVRVFATPHGPAGPITGPLLHGEIKRPLPSPIWFGSMKDRENFSFLIEHGGRRVLVHPSAGLHSAAYRDQPADVVFLGIGRLGFQSREDIDAYWREIVGATGARRVIPVHWDLFTRGLGEKLKASPLPFDWVSRARRHLRRLAGKEVDIHEMSTWDTLVLPPR